MDSTSRSIMAGAVLIVAASATGGTVATSGGAAATQVASAPVVELLVDGRAAPDALAWSDLGQAAITLRITGVSDVAPRPRSASVSCTDRASGEGGRATVPLQGSPDDGQRLDLAAAVPGLPYPIDPLAIESKPAAIISQQARRSVLLVPPRELRLRFRDTAAYMLQTADHHYRVPYGDGVLDCRVGVADGGSGNGADQEVVARPLAIAFGRGLPPGPFARDISSPPLAAWPHWVAAAEDLPGDLAGAVRHALVQPESPAVSGVDDEATLIARRVADDGAAPGPWIEQTLGLVATNGVNPPRAARALALVSVAMSDALRIRRELDDRDGGPRARPGVARGEHTVAAAAAATVLAGLFPDDLELLSPLTAAAAAWSSGDPDADDAFRRLGSWVGDQVMARSEGDGSSEAWTGTPPAAAWAWHSVDPTSGGPLEPLAGTWRPWNLVSGSAFRPPAPPRPGDPVFERDLQEVRSIRSTLDIAEQQIASYWEDKYGSLTPPGHWTAIALRMVRAEGWSTDDVALLFALLSTAQADAFIAAWDAKYAYWSMRPVAAIRASIDPAWGPYVPTPDFPSYVSGHATTSGAAAAVLAALAPSHSKEIEACATEAAESRLLGGIHFRTDNIVGLQLGGQVGHEALARADIPAIVSTLPWAAAPLDCLWEAGRA